MNRNHVILRGLLLTFVVCSFSGCASIMSEKKYEVTMDNKGGPTYFTVHDHKNRVVQSGMTPQQVTLPAKTKWLMPAKYTVGFAGVDGIERHQLKAGLDWWTGGNIILGGIPGFIVDAATGAMWKLDERVTGQVPQQSVVANAAHGGAMMASYSTESTSGSDNPQGTTVRQASFGMASQQ